MALARLPPLSGSTSTPYLLERLEGPSYRVNGKLHALPSPRALKPYVDTQAGELDTWPAHASSLATSTTVAVLNKNKNLMLVKEDEKGKITPKPRFLEQLETFLKKELQALGVTDVQPSELRLQAHREVFEYLIEDFKTYRPLLSTIKNEYEMMLAHQRQQIRQLEPLKQMLVTMSEECDLKIMAIREDEKGEISDLKKENRKLYGQISNLMVEQEDLKEQVNNLKKKLEEEYKKYRDECDARKLLVADVNDLRYQQEDYIASKNAALMNQDTEEDPVIMKIALQKSREAETAATKRLNEMIANYGDVIPRRDFEMLEAKFKELEEKYELSQQDFRKMQAEYNALLDVQKQVTQKRDEFYIELETLKRSSTPRPHWDKCADYVQGGSVRWQQLSEGKRSTELVDVLLNEIQVGGFVDTVGADYFDPQGTGAEVPIYLRHDQPVRNRRLSKRDTALLVRDIWRTKSVKDAERTDGTRQNMGEFLFDYLKTRFPLEQIVIEWGYNLHDACQRFAHDDVIGLFGRVLNGEADEEIFHSQLLTIHGLLTQMTKLDNELGNVGTLGSEDFKKCLREFFHLSGDNEDDSSAEMTMFKAANVELEITDEMPLDYKSLFTEDDEGKTGPFLDEVKTFLKTKKEQYINDIKEQLEANSTVSVDDLMRAISIVDPEITHDKIQEYLAWAFHNTKDGLKDVNPVDQSILLERLINGNITRLGRK
ncbi:translin-associated factor X-interacting protein 1-like [Biomphalaria glabrata]|uniref:Translin-associated factor X-interacting protein 1-like n=1 Tax=Biomphalaria glabrata TaxID=6526 RepID=A0A9W3AV17_BIOGL|nr:translin-associated factor X-interacting protein 1-like [Biomphalaria glabrata]